MVNLSVSDIESIRNHGLTPEQVEAQLLLLNGGVKETVLDRPATPGDGILVLTEQEKQKLAGEYPSLSGDLDVVKFVPASGAATRMFRDLYAFVETGAMNASVSQFVERIQEFAFHQEWVAEFGYKGDPREMIRFLLFEKGYGKLPKGLIPFHREGERSFQPIESHIVEALDYSTLSDGTVAVHFTFSPEHIHLAEQVIWNTVFELEDKHGAEFTIRISEQDSSTDTIALTENGKLYRAENGDLVFRPGGHGSLLNNLQSTEADLVFIRNIDNILPPKRRTENVFYKQVAGALLNRLVRSIHQHIHDLRESKKHSIPDAVKFIREKFDPSFSEKSTHAQVIDFLNRPVRVAAMVRNEGEPGGGPFWVRDAEGKISLQIVESVQVSANDDQQQILRSATHFNPVDMVCYMRDYSGNSFDLTRFVDPSTSLIVYKTIGEHKVKGLEHPGLWNGSMAGWLTVFIEVPVSTFNPVKTVNDLLKPSHHP